MLYFWVFDLYYYRVIAVSVIETTKTVFTYAQEDEMSVDYKENLATLHNQSIWQRFTTALRQELQPPQLLASLSSGVICGIIAVIVSIAFANLVFAGNLALYLPAGINLMLLATMSLAVMATLTSSLPGVVAGVQDGVVAVLAVVAATIVQVMPATATPAESFFTIIAAIGFSTVLTGVIFVLLGYFKLGYLIRFIPYPVIGGFLAGSGLLLVLGALSTMVSSFNGLFDIPQLFSVTALPEWLPGAIYAIVLFVALNRINHPLTLPGMLLGGVLVFHGISWLWPGFSSVSPAGVSDGSTSPVGTSFGDLLLWFNLQYVNWPIVLRQAMSGVSVAVVSVITLLLNASGLELETKSDLDLNRELKVMGISNILVGLGGGAAGSHILSETTLIHRMGGKSRLAGLVLAAVCGLVLLTGEAWLQLLPEPVLGGVLLFLGLDFLVTWVYQTWFKLPLVDYGIIILILLVITLVGFLEGVGVGLALTVLLFVVDYSRVNIVRHQLSGATYQSNFQYPRLYQKLLKRKGHQICILELQGFIFFGTAHKLLEQVRQRLNQQPAPRFVVLDFRLVTGFDTSAVFSFTRLKQLALMQDVVLVFTHLSPKMLAQLEKDVLLPDEPHIWRVFPDLDRGVEWCESQFVQTLESVGFKLQSHGGGETASMAQKPDKLQAFLDAVPADGEYLADSGSFDVACLRPYLQPTVVAPGDTLIRQGEPVAGLYFIESGQVTVQLAQGDGQTVRLSTMGAGSVVGELSFYLGTPASASVVVDQPGQVYVLSMAKLEELEASDPQIKGTLHKFMAYLLSERLFNANTTLQALLK